MVSIMERIHSQQQDAVSRFWENYIEILVTQGVKDTVRRWHVKRVEQYIAYYPDERLASHTPQHVTKFFKELGRNSRLKDWQIRQAVDAIRILFCDFLNLHLCDSV